MNGARFKVRQVAEYRSTPRQTWGYCLAILHMVCNACRLHEEARGYAENAFGRSGVADHILCSP